MADPNMNANSSTNTPSSPMNLGMAAPPGVGNPFTVDEIQELMGLIPADQQQHHHSAPAGAPGSPHGRGSNLDEMHPPMHVNAVAVSSASSAGLASVLGGASRRASLVTSTMPRSSSATSQGLKGAVAEIDDGTKNQARSERKRSREKQRRTDVNKQFGELTEVLKRIEAEEQQHQQERAAREDAREGGNNGSRMILPPFSPTNRVDLIARTIAHLERLSHVTKKQVQEMQSLEDQLKTAQKAGEDMAQKLKEAVFNQQQQGGMMMMNGMMGANGSNQMFNPMQMAMGGMNPMAAGAPGTNGMMSMQPQKQQMMMVVPMMMPPGGTNGVAGGANGTAMMQGGGQPLMMMPQGFMPAQQPQQNAAAPGPSAANSTGNTSASSTSAPSPGNGPSPASTPQLQNQQAMMMQQQNMMMQSMQPMMQQMQMMQPPQQPQTMQQQQQPPAPQQQQQPQAIYPAPPQPAPIMAAPMAAPATAGMAASQQRQQQVPQQQQQQRSSSSGLSGGSNGSNNGSSPSQQQSGSYAYAA